MDEIRLSWDLHVHPGSSASLRWGDGRRVWEAAERAGVAGFVWKSHDEHTHALCTGLPPGPPLAIASASLNSWATVDDVISAVQGGARWIWGPTRDRVGQLGWNLPLPPWWGELRERLQDVTVPVVLATGHLDAQGREALAAAAADTSSAVCSVTHSQFLSLDEARRLNELDCLFEIDVFTCMFHPTGQPRLSLTTAINALSTLGVFVYLTSDGGQQETGDPFAFSTAALARLRQRIDGDTLRDIADFHPAEVAGRIGLTDVT